MHRFDFAFDTAYRLPALMFGVTPATTGVIVDDHDLRIRFGPWFVHTPLDNIKAAVVTGPYGYVKTAGPARLSLADRGITFATNGDRGLCIDLHEPIAGIDPVGAIRHPNITVTVADPAGLAVEVHRP